MAITTEAHSNGHTFRAWEKHTLTKGRVQGGMLGIFLGLLAGLLLPLLT